MSDESFADFRQADGRFAKGNRGGPDRPRARDRIVALDHLVAEAGADLIEATLKEARGSNVKAIEMLLNRIWPAPRSRPVEIETPGIRGTPALVPASAVVTNAVLNGDVTPQEGRAAARVLDVHANMIAAADLGRRMSALEAEMAKDRER